MLVYIHAGKYLLLAVKWWRQRRNVLLRLQKAESILCYVVTGDGRRRRPPNHRAPAEPRRPHAEPRGRLPRWDGNTKDSGIDTSSSATLSEDTHKVHSHSSIPFLALFCISLPEPWGHSSLLYSYLFIYVFLNIYLIYFYKHAGPDWPLKVREAKYQFRLPSPPFFVLFRKILNYSGNSSNS